GRTWTQRPAIQTTGRRAAIAALLLGGGRASATGAMVRRDVDLANGRFEVGRDKTDAGMREVDMLPLLREILTEHKAASDRTGPEGPVVVTTTRRARSRDNLRQDVVDAVVAHANKQAPMPASDSVCVPPGLTRSAPPIPWSPLGSSGFQWPHIGSDRETSGRDPAPAESSSG